MFRHFAFFLFVSKELNALARTPDNVLSRLQINIPHSLYREDGYEHREALFGTPAYGGSLSQGMYYADSNLCDPNVDTRSGYPVRKNDSSGKQEVWPAPYILMVDRGECTFVQKVRNAQRSGAAGVIIADNVCLCSDANCVSNNKDGSCQTSEPIMADDGSGSDITIPAFLLFKHDADQLKAEMKANTLIQIEMSWSLPSPDDRVEYDLWTVPSEIVSRKFFQNFKVVAEKLGDRAYFSPHMYVYDGIRSGCQGPNGVNQCYNLCTNNGRYCATDPDNDLDRGISGADVVTEALRRICIWKNFGESDGIGAVWWEYVNKFADRCDTPDYFTNKDCISDVMKHAGVEERSIDQCMRDSGGLDKDSPNAFLEAELDSATRRGVVILPTAFVNTAALRGALNTNNVFQAICAGFLEGTEPKICKKCMHCSDRQTCVEKGKCVSGGDGSKFRSVPFHTYILSMIVISSGIGLIGFVYYRKSQEQMRDQVRGILAEYMPLEDNDNSDNSAVAFAKMGNTPSGSTMIS